MVLKTVGLLTLATLSGLFITAEEETEIAVFNKIFVDIGDNQSSENALSTFSSHIKNIADIMRVANNNTLLLFDEIGSGTEPNEGAALAISILEEFYQMGCISVSTTHYGEIKRFSELHPDFINAAMQFNQETLEPIYKLLIGRSGESNALWISRRMKLREKVVKRAKEYMESKDYQLTKVREEKVRKEKEYSPSKEEQHQYQKGDKVFLIDYNDSALIYEEEDKYRNVVVFYQEKFLEINVKRIELEFPATELYPRDYDLNTLFTDFRTRKLEHDIKRGSKKALRKIQKEMKS